MKKNGFIVLLLVLILWPATSMALMYSDIYVFGDSLADQGNDYVITGGLVPPSEYTDGTNFGRFSNGLVFTDYLAAGLGIVSTPSVMGGNNFAYGGARTYYQRPELGPLGALSFLEQKDAYLNRLGMGSADEDALFVVWAGANNLGDILQLGLDPNQEIPRALQDIGFVIDSLADKGAKHFLVPNMPNIGLTPLVASAGPAAVAGATLLTQIFNGGFEATLASLELKYFDIDLIRFDTFGLFNDLYGDPAAFGFTNVTNPCYSLYVASGGTECADSSTYASWDGFHPTSAVHKLMGQQMTTAVVPEPSTMFLLGIGFTGLVWYRQKRQKT